MLPARTLTFRFDPVVTAPGESPEEWEIVVLPLTSPLDGTIPDATLVGNRRKQTFVMSNSVVVDVPFDIVPSDAPGLSTTVWYRAGWRPRFFGKLTTYDFTMPDADLTFNQLQDLGDVIGSEVYLRQSDLGVHVAPLDSEGFVLDGNGVRVGVDDSAAMAAVNQERIDRQTADLSLRQNLEDQITDQVAQTLNTATVRINAAVAVLESADTAETVSRQAAVNQLNVTIAGVATDLNADLATLAGVVASHTAALPNKADLVGGYLATSQIPTLALTTAVPVTGEIQMLALSTSQVQPGDLAVRPDGTWLLLSYPTATLANWIRLSSGGDGIQTINGQSGAVVTLSAADVGAIAIGAMIPQSEIANLVADLAAKASTTTVSGINTRLTIVEADATIVRTTAGLIAKALLPTDSVFVDGSGLLRKKDGTLITTGGPGATVDWTQVVNTPSTFPPTIGVNGASAVAGNDVRLTNARTPTSHAASHAVAGSDPLTLTAAQVTGLAGTLTSLGNRASSLETRVTDLEAGGGGGGGGGATSAKTLWFDGPLTSGVTDMADFQAALVLQKGPFGQASDLSYYYKPTGADDTEWRYPFVSRNGHLSLRKWDETAPPDPDMATQVELDAVSSALALKADSSVVTTLTATVATKALQSDMSTVQTTLAAKADSSTVSALTTVVNGKADASTVAAKADTTTVNAALALKADASALAAKANQTDLDALTTTVNGKALASDLSTLAGRVTTAETAITGKADASATTAALATKADASATTAALAGKADLVGGKLATSQIPSLAINDTFVRSNRAGMLALTTTQVQNGDVCIITATVDKGSYIYIGTDPSSFTDWTLMSVPADAVQSVNGQTGNPVLTAADVNARSASVAVPMADVSGLTTALSNKVDTTTYTAGLATRTSPSDVQTLLTQAANKLVVDVVATSNITLSGTPSIDGVLTSAGMRVLATAQSSSINNGVFVVSAGSWSRATDMFGPTPSNTTPVGEYYVRGNMLIASSGTANANTIWVQTSASGIVGTNANNWIKALTAGPPLVYTAATNSGLTITGTAIVVKNTTGISVTTSGVGVDHTVVPFKFAGDVPAGSASATITHNLGTQDISSVVLMDKTSRVMSLVGWTADTVNTIVIEFATAPTTGQWRAVVTA